ncbi:hypothetical protein QUW14_10335, partial [Bacteroides gallinaceum]|uniref:hypothetical protein n=1 Tax=Bacteroides gallinaceum TaxID=1462571 RepID=UPI0025A4C114
MIVSANVAKFRYFANDFYTPSEVHPKASVERMQAMLRQASVAGLAISCMKTVLKHGGLYII